MASYRRHRARNEVRGGLAQARRPGRGGALHRSDELKDHTERATEVVTHMAFYAGWPTAMTAARIA